MTMSEYVDTNRRFHGGNTNSQAAHKSIVQHKSQLAQTIYACILDQGILGATCDEIEVLTGLKHQSVSSIMVLLKANDEIRPGVDRPTRSGRNATAWVAKELLGKQASLF